MHGRKPEDDKLALMISLAKELGFCVYERQKLLAHLGHSLSARLRTRGSNFQYQSVAFRISNIPRSFCQEVFPTETVTENSTTIQTWRFESMSSVSQIFAKLLASTKDMTAGSTRALQLPSERVVRLVSTAINPMEISWVHLVEQNHDAMYVNFNFILADEDGELHMPKDQSRREMAINNEHEIRHQVLEDVRAMAEKNCMLGPGWWRQLGMEEKAAEVEDMLRNPAQRPLRSHQMRTLSGSRWAAGEYEIDRILEECNSTGRAVKWYRVRWKGYDPSWEAWRINGNPGDPVETWEPLLAIAHTEALMHWNVEQQEQQEQQARLGASQQANQE